VPEAAAYAAAIDGTDGRSWHLPLPPLTATSLPQAHAPGEQPEVDRLQVTTAMCSHVQCVAASMRASDCQVSLQACMRLIDDRQRRQNVPLAEGCCQLGHGPQ
jgi:hypothetical protein